MASEMIEAFFQVVRTGSVGDLKKMLMGKGPEETAEIVNSPNADGETPLIAAIKRDHNYMVTFLIEDLQASANQLGRFIWKGLDYLEVPPLFVAIFTTKSFDHVGIKKYVYLLLESTADEIIEAVLSSRISRIQKIDVLELIGAAFNFLDTRNMSLGFNCWQEAMTIRSQSIAIPKVPYHLPDRARIAFDNTTEFASWEEFEDLYDSLDDGACFKYIETQSLLIIRRITSQIHTEPNIFLHNCLLMHSMTMIFLEGQSERLFYVASLSLDGLGSCQWEDFDKMPYYIIFNVLSCFMSITNELAADSSSKFRSASFGTFVEVLNLFSHFQVRFLPLVRDSPLNFMDLDLNGMVEFIFKTFVWFFPLLDFEETRTLQKWLCQHTHIANGFYDVNTLMLHYYRSSASILKISIKYIHLLLEARADPMITDNEGNAPFHYLAIRHTDQDDYKVTVQILLDARVHLDQKNAENVTPLQMIKRKKLAMDRVGRPDPFLGTLLNTVLPLTCYCAQVIRQNGIPFENELPLPLASLVQKH